MNFRSALIEPPSIGVGSGSIPAGTKSLAYALSYQAADRTLADKEIDKAHKKIEDRLKQVLKATIRGKE